MLILNKYFKFYIIPIMNGVWYCFFHGYQYAIRTRRYAACSRRTLVLRPASAKFCRSAAWLSITQCGQIYNLGSRL